MTVNVAFVAAQPAPALDSTNAAGPRIQFDCTTNDFGQVLAGEPVKHIYTFTNLGRQDLVISKVLPGCGCTSAGDWTRVAKPGEIGIIPIQLNTAGFVGTIDKAISVTCNDPSQPVVALKLRGTVRRALEMNPSVAILKLLPDSPFGAATIRITNCLEAPLLLSAPQSTNTALTAELNTNVFGREYLVIISNTIALPPGNLMANITLKTSLTNLPVLGILTLANVSPTFTAMPSQINLAPGPLTTGQVAYVSIINNGTNPITLSDPRVSDSGVEVSLRETKPGLAFTAVLSFPTGFKLPHGQKDLFSVRTSHPQCPIVELPICQVPNTVPAAPLLKRTSLEVVTASLPMVFQTEALRSSKLSQEQQEAVDELRKQFIEEIGGLSQDPSDPAYLARWQKARPKADGMLAGVIGQRALMRFDMGPASDSSSE